MYFRALFAALCALVTVFSTGCGAGGSGPIATPSSTPAPTGVLREIFAPFAEKSHPISGMRYGKFIPGFVGWLNYPDARFIFEDGSFHYFNNRGDHVLTRWDNSLGAFYTSQSSDIYQGSTFVPFPKLSMGTGPDGWTWGGDGTVSDHYVTSEATLWKGAEAIRIKDVAPAGWRYLYVLGVGRGGSATGFGSENARNE